MTSERQNQVEVTTRQENDWVEYDPHDLKTHPKEGALVLSVSASRNGMDLPCRLTISIGLRATQLRHFIVREMSDREAIAPDSPGGELHPTCGGKEPPAPRELSQLSSILFNCSLWRSIAAVSSGVSFSRIASSFLGSNDSN